MNIIARAVLTALPAALLAVGQTPIASCPFTISAPGNYVVVADLICVADGIDISASNVSVNLNHHIITGPGQSNASFFGISIGVFGTSGTLNHVAIEGPGLVQRFPWGIYVKNCDFCQVGLATSANNVVGLQVDTANYATVASNVVTQNQTVGLVLVDSNNSVVRNNDTSGNVRAGLTVAFGVGNTVNNNTSNGNGTGISLAPGASTRVFSNVTNGNSTQGIWIFTGSTGNEVFNNTSSVGNGGNDLQDDTAACGTNYWIGNVFFTRSPVTCVN